MKSHPYTITDKSKTRYQQNFTSNTLFEFFQSLKTEVEKAQQDETLAVAQVIDNHPEQAQQSSDDPDDEMQNALLVLQ